MYDERLPRKWYNPWSWRKPKHGNIYYARLNTPEGIFYKLGVTSKNSVIARFSYAGNSHLVNKTFLFVYLEDAYPVEKALHKAFKNKKAFPKGNSPTKPLYRDGQSELYTEDVLGLDESLYAEYLTALDEYESLHPLDKAATDLGIAVELLIDLIAGALELFAYLFDRLMGIPNSGVEIAQRSIFPPVHSKKVTNLLSYIRSAQDSLLVFPEKNNPPH